MNTIHGILASALNLYQMAVVIYILMSWFPGARDSGIGRALATIVEPYLEPFRRIIPPLGMFDISPIVALLVLQFATNGLNVLFGLF